MRTTDKTLFTELQQQLHLKLDGNAHALQGYMAIASPAALPPMALTSTAFQFLYDNEYMEACHLFYNKIHFAICKALIRWNSQVDT